MSNWYKEKTAQTNAPKKLYLMRGVSGSGKSTTAKSLGGQVFSTDDYFMKNGTYQFDPKMIGQAHEWNRFRVKGAMEKGISPIVVDNTNTQFWEMKPYALLAKEFGYEVEFKQPNWDKNLYKEDGKWNIDFLDGKNKHGVDRNILERMISRFEYDPSVEKVLNSKAPWEK